MKFINRHYEARHLQIGLQMNSYIKIVQVDGSDGNGYYGTGYEILVKIPRDTRKIDI